MCDTNMFFTLGSDKRPVNPLLEGGKDGGKDDYLPARWDLSLQGMAVGEVRQIDLPPALGLQSAAYKPEAVFKQDNLDVRTKVSGNVGALAMGEVKVSKGVAGSSDGETNTVDFGSTNSARRSKSLSAHPGSALVLTVRLLSINGETRKGKLSDQSKYFPFSPLSFLFSLFSVPFHMLYSTPPFMYSPPLPPRPLSMTLYLPCCNH